ncbi:MAG: hypothetical protein M1416_03065 [Candidatus Pacearchaeota archaeon]|nr:hypothetical protein [Candidatus Pacearchaeota archaeon]
MKKNLLVTLADRNYIEQAKQLFSSVYWNAGWKGDYMLLAHEIPEKDLKWFRDKGILIKKCKLLIEKAWGGEKESEKFSPIIADKFYLFTQEFKKWKNIVYLDADIIVRANLDELTKVKKFGAVNDFHLGKLKKQFVNSKDIPAKIKRKYNLNKISFNAGVFAFNTSIIKDNTFSDINFLLQKNLNFFYYGEQTALNLYFYNKWKKIPLAYNLCVDGFNYYHAPQKGIILHFAGSNKPWRSGNPCYNEWKKNLEKAELIDLNDIPSGQKFYEIKIYHKFSFFLRLNLFYYNLKLFLIHLKNKYNEFIGKIGILIKKKNPDMYYFLRKILFYKLSP